MYRRSMVGCLCLALLAVAAGSLPAAESEPAADGESVWVTSIARLGETDEFVAATADGLLLREAAVVSFPGNNPAARTELYKHPAAVWSVAATSGGDRIASVDYRGNLIVFDKASSQPTLHEKAFERWCQAMIVTPDDQFVIAGNEAGKVMAWDLGNNKVERSVELDGHAVTGLALSPDASQLAVSDGGGHVHLLKWPELEPLGKIDVSDQTAWCVAFVNQGSHLLVGSSDRQLYRCEAKPEAKAEVVAKGTDWITELAVSPSGQVAAAEVGGRLHFPTSGGSDSMEAKSGVWALCWNGDGQLFAGTRKDGIVIAGRTWTWTEPKPAPAPAAEQPAPAAEQPEPAAEEKSADEKAAEAGEAKEEAKDAEAKPAGEPAADENEKQE